MCHEGSCQIRDVRALECVWEITCQIFFPTIDWPLFDGVFTFARLNDFNGQGVCRDGEKFRSRDGVWGSGSTSEFGAFHGVSRTDWAFYFSRTLVWEFKSIDYSSQEQITVIQLLCAAYAAVLCLTLSAMFTNLCVSGCCESLKNAISPSLLNS